jgi:serine/threonine protein kinase
MKYDSKVDVWAYGAVVYELLTGRQFAEKGRKDAKKNFKNCINDMVFSQMSETFSN